jgi:uncharacterized protein YcbK (DUF882 family)
MLATADWPLRLALNTSFDVGSQVPLKTARRSNGYHRSLRLGGCASLAALLILVGSQSLQNATANGDTRSLSFRNTHTNEKLTITYKVNGRYDDEALKKLNHVLRDWREDQATSMDPHLLDLIWDVYRDVEATEPIAIVCGYRSPGTNAMLRRRSSGVAKFSQHMLGKAMDFYIPGVPLEKLREAGLRAARGGVGFYPSSNFVHLDTGSVRHWPRMPEAELAKVMAKGPITAVAARKTDTKVASARFPNPFAKLFGFSGEDEEDAETLAATAPAARTAEAKKPAPKTSEKSSEKTSAKISEKSAERPAAVAAAPAATTTPASRPASQPAGSFDLASASSRPVELRPARAAGLVNGGDASANAVISERGFWQTSPDNSAQLSAAAKSAAASAAARVASADVASTGNTPWPAPDRAATGSALSYAPASHPSSPSRPAAASAQPAARTAQAAPTPQRDTTVAVKRGAEPQATTTPAPSSASAQTLAAALAQAKAGQQFNDPWMRAMIVAPSAGAFMSTSLLGTTDFRTLSPYLQKPSSSVMMTFAKDDPHLGMSTQRFAGTAVVFVSTVTFSRRTASLR